MASANGRGVLIVNGRPAGEVLLAESPVSRFFGLMGRRNVPASAEGMYFRSCSSVHTAFMRFPLDVAYVRSGVVTRVVEGVPPWRVTFGRRANDTLELPAGSASRLGLQSGALIEVRV